MPAEPSLSDRYRSDQCDLNLSVRKGTAGSTGEGNITEGNADASVVVVMTENAEEVSIAHTGVAFQHQLHELEQQKQQSRPTHRATASKVST